MLKGLESSQFSRRSLALLATSAALAAAAVAVGIDDNPLGVGFGLLSAIAFVVAFTHSWTDSRRFRRLVYASLLATVAFALISNVVEAAASGRALPPALDGALNVAAVAAMLLAPASFLVGVAGAILTWRREHRAAEKAEDD